jgi:hypothetical protein
MCRYKHLTADGAKALERQFALATNTLYSNPENKSRKIPLYISVLFCSKTKKAPESGALTLKTGAS